MVLNKFIVTTKPLEEVLVDYNTTYLHASLAMFVKRLCRATLVENFEEAKKIHRVMSSIVKNCVKEDLKVCPSKKPLLINKYTNENTMDLGSVV